MQRDRSRSLAFFKAEVVGWLQRRLDDFDKSEHVAAVGAQNAQLLVHICQLPFSNVSVRLLNPASASGLPETMCVCVCVCIKPLRRENF